MKRTPTQTNPRLLPWCLLVLGTIALLAACGGPEDDTASHTAPPDSPHPHAYYLYPTPPPGFQAVIGWAQAVHDTRKSGPSTVEVDWLRLWAVVDGRNVLLAEDDYAAFDPESRWFGLYLRKPWFGGDVHLQMPVAYEGGFLVFRPSTHPDRVWHWWPTEYPRPTVPAGAQRVWFEARVRITGPALVQLGIDFWRTPTAQWAGHNINNMQAGVSDWFGEDREWQVISVGRP